MATRKRTPVAKLRPSPDAGLVVVCGRRPRAYANLAVGQGIALLFHAFNACDNPDLPYRYSDADRAKFFGIVRQLIELADDGEIVECAEARAKVAKADAGFQQFIAAVTNT